MSHETLRLGSRGDAVIEWQRIIGVVADGYFGPQTERWTKDWQANHGLVPDGVVGPKSWTVALGVASTPIPTPMLPVPPAWLHPLIAAERSIVFGHFDYEPLAAPPGAIRILGTWQHDNIRRVIVPELCGVTGASEDGAIFCHRLMVEPITGLFRAWREAGFIERVLSFAGCWAPRCIRGSTSILSNHAWGTALDVNAPENGLGRSPAPVGSPGSVAELVPIAAGLGFWWGGWFPVRTDGMHFEASAQLAERVRAG